MTAIGKPRPRLEGRAKVTGSARYAADEQMPDLAHGSIVLSTVSRGRIRGIDVAAVLDMPGVLGVIDHRNAPRLNPAAGGFFGPDGGLQLLQDDVVPFAGRPVALVVAETPEQARAAADALPVTYDEQPHDTVFSAGHPAARPALALWGAEANVGDVEAELAGSAVVVDERYQTPEEHCSAMEPHAAIAWWEGERLQAVDANQGPFFVAGVLAALFSLNHGQVRIRAEHVGGGFGSKGLCGPQLILAVMATTRFGRPVRVTLTRDQVFLATARRPPTDQRVRLGADADGRLRAVHHEAAFALSPLVEYIEGCTEITKVL
ncbi:MAG: molybdopterin cofactor-binding domain-containing protein, partial [Kibdelosporangium sp.]